MANKQHKIKSLMEFSKDFCEIKVKRREELSCYIVKNDIVPIEINDNMTGVYILEDENNNILYIGKAKKMRTRLSAHISLTSRSLCSWIPKGIIKKVYCIECEETESEMIEQIYLYFYETLYNKKGMATINNRKRIQ